MASHEHRLARTRLEVAADALEIFPQRESLLVRELRALPPFSLAARPEVS